MKRFSMVAVVVGVSALVGSVAFAQAPQPRVEESPACAAAAGAEHTSIEKSPECRYLEKCCQGNTDNAKKCCAGYLKRCGGRD